MIVAKTGPQKAQSAASRLSHGMFGLLLAAMIGGCSSAPSAPHTGFLSDYSALRTVSEQRMNYVSPQLTRYDSFIVDPVKMRTQEGDLSTSERAEVASYFRESLIRVLTSRGYTVSTTPGPKTGRIRIALTRIHESTWWMKIHPASSLAGAGRGGAAMEGEIVDSTTGNQLAAVVQSGVGNQFTVGNFSTVSDIKNVIDQWTETAGDRIDEMRRTRR